MASDSRVAKYQSFLSYFSVYKSSLFLLLLFTDIIESTHGSPLSTIATIDMFIVEIVKMIERVDCVLSKRTIWPYIYGHASANACVLIYV